MNIFREFQRRRVAIALVLMLMSHACGGGGGSGENGETPGTNITQAASVIGIDGGEVMISGSGSPADGAKVIIPESALVEDNTITISHGETDIDTPDEIDPAGGQIDFGPDGLRFLLPVHISIPYSDDDNDGIIDGTNIAENNVKLIYYNEESGEWEKIAVINRNAQVNLVEAETSHFSTYLVAIDSSIAAGDDDDSTASGYASGEYFVGSPEYRVSGDGNEELIVKGCIGQDYSACSESGNCKPCGSHYVLTVKGRDGTIKAVVDKRTTYTGGVPAAMNSDGTGFIFDAASVFEKIKNSGDTALWAWRCEYITEYTRLPNYVACNDTTAGVVCTDAGDRILPSIDIVDETTILFNLGIDISDRSNASNEPLVSNNFATGDMIAIRFEANYN